MAPGMIFARPYRLALKSRHARGMKEDAGHRISAVGALSCIELSVANHCATGLKNMTFISKHFRLRRRLHED
jgi:hypothetical protein